MPRKTDFKTMSEIELAAAQGVSTQTLDQWLNRGMPYVAKPGAGDLSTRPVGGAALAPGL